VAGVAHAPTLAAENVQSANAGPTKEVYVGVGISETPKIGVGASKSSSQGGVKDPKDPSKVVTFVKVVDKRTRPDLAAQVTALWREAFGDDEDAMQRRRDEDVAALLIEGKVVGFAGYVIRRDLMSLSINKLAVAAANRRCGLGRLMLRHLMQVAKSRSRGEVPLDVVCLSALPSSVSFYKACGFREDINVKLSCASDVVEGQVYMACRLRRRLRSVSTTRAASKTRSTSKPRK
jgi:GNAT superfamily N-acetyltransferase